MASGSQNNTTYQAQKWTNLRAFTIGDTAKNVDGTAAVSWSKDEILGASTDAYFLRGDKTWSNTLNGVLLLPNGLKTGARVSDSGSGIVIDNDGGIEIFHTSTPFIDFHYQASTADYSVRLLCNSATNIHDSGSFTAGKYITAGGDVTANGGYLYSTLNGNTVQIGSQNGSYAHFTNTKDIPFWFNKVIQSDGGFTIYNTGDNHWRNGYIKINNSGGGDCYVELRRAANADWRMLNSGGHLYFQSNWTSAKGSYYNVLQLEYNSGNINVLRGNISISHATSADMAHSSTNPKITFSESGGQPVHLIYTDYDSYRSPAGLKVVGGANASPAWFEVEGSLYLGAPGATGTGIYWNPYVESATDASDAGSIYQIKAGVAGGTELRISQLNDATDCINLCTNSYIYFNSKKAFTINDAWLRINEDKGFSSGVYFGTSTVRTDGEFWSDSVRIVDNLVGFYNAVQGATRYGYIQANANRMYFRKENGVSTFGFDFNSHLYTTGHYYASNAGPHLYLAVSDLTNVKDAKNGLSANREQGMACYSKDYGSWMGDFAQGYTQSNGQIWSRIYLRNYKTDGTNVNNYIYLYANKDGTTSYAVANAAAFRSAIGAGTSSLTIGTTASTAAAGNHSHSYIDQHAGFAKGSKPSSTTYLLGSWGYETGSGTAVKNRFFGFEGYVNTNGTSAMSLIAYQNTAGSTAGNSITVWMDQSGNRGYTVSDAAAFRSAISSPSTTGSGASGTWGISVTGSSASCTGNAKTATTLQTARNINGTSFNGSANITTANWGTARNFTIKDYNSNNAGTAVSVNGSGAVTLLMPSTIYCADVRSGKTRIVSDWIGFYQSDNAGGKRYGYIECDVNRMYFRKENSSSQTHYFDFGSAVYIAGELNSGGVRARGGMMALSEANSGNCAVWFVNSTNTESYWKAAVQSDKEAFVFYRYSGTTPQWRFAIRSNGTTSTSSSRKIKHNIQDINFNTGYIIDRMKPVSYIVNGDTTNQITYGFIYEDLVQVLPNVCVSSDGNVGIMYTTIIPVLTKEIQNLRKRLAAVETELNYYRSKI